MTLEDEGLKQRPRPVEEVPVAPVEEVRFIDIPLPKTVIRIGNCVVYDGLSGRTQYNEEVGSDDETRLSLGGIGR
jgi:hypothetical protein